MRKIKMEVTLSLWFLSVCSPTVLAGTPGEAQLPADFRIEFSAGEVARSRLGTSVTPLDDSFPAAREVWYDLLRDPALAHLQLPFRWQLVLVDDHSINARSLPDGEVIIDRKLASLLAQDRGLWAALLSHEIAHIARRHWVRRYLFESQRQQHLQIYQGTCTGIDRRWQMAELDAHMDGPAASLKFARELELEADSEGMMLMARTGFHPDFALAIHRLLQANGGESSTLATTFSTHPGWIGRDRNVQRIHHSALEEFSRRWPAVTDSPGGLPPTVVFLGKPRSESNQKMPLAVSFSIRCVNPGRTLKSVLRLYKKSGESGAQQEAIEYWEPTTCSDHNEKKTVAIQLPSDKRTDDNWTGEVVILDPQNVAIERSDFFTVHLGKIETPSSTIGAMAFQDSPPIF
jgi:Zn-dependent protease with chaperone function